MTAAGSRLRHASRKHRAPTGYAHAR